jgi:hypothetical protein
VGIPLAGNGQGKRLHHDGSQAQCHAFYQFMRTCAPENASEQDLKRMDRNTEYMSNLSFDVGTRSGMTMDAMLSRLKMAAEQQAKLIEGKCVNAASLMTRYLYRCKFVAENLSKVFLEYERK